MATQRFPFFLLSSLLLVSGCTTMTPLTKAAKDCDISTVRTLTEKGGNVNETSTGKQSASSLHWVAYNCNDEDALKIMRILIEKGALVDTKDNSGNTPLLLASSGKPKSAMYLVEKGANIGTRDKNGNSPLLNATASNSPELIKSLIARGANVNTFNNEGTTPLINAVIYGDIETVKYLLDKGADPLHGDSNGEDALSHAKSHGKNDIAQLLLKDIESRPELVKNRLYAMLMIKSIVSKVKNCMMPDAKEYQVLISNNAKANASVNISGKITFTQGALKLWDEDILIFITAHEIAHDKLGHVGKQIAVSAVTTGIMIVAGHFIPGIGLLNHAINPAIVNNYSKTQELEADKLAADECERCFGMTNEKQIEIMYRIMKTSNKDGGGFWATHPAWTERIRSIKK